MKKFLNKGIPMPKIVLGTRGCGKTIAAQQELEEFIKAHPDEPVIIAPRPLNLQASPLKRSPEEELKFIEQITLNSGKQLSEFEKENLYKTLKAAREKHKKQKE